MRQVLIVGASRGIGRGLVERHLTDGWTVHATTRDGRPFAHPDVIVHQLDVRDPAAILRLTEEIDEPLARVIHNAGVMSGPRSEIMAVNAVAPIRVVQALLDAGRLASGGVIAIMTSQVGARRGRTGSLGDYGDSKAALNDEFRRRVEAWRLMGTTAVVVHPGWVRTDMGGPGAPLGVDESVDGVVRVLDGLMPRDHGRFVTWEGRDHPW